MTRYRDRYEEIYEQLSRAELQKGSTGLDELSAGPELFGWDNERWLGFYTDEGLETALDRYGFIRDLQRKGFDEIRIETRIDDPDRHLLRLWSTRPLVDEPLVELTVRRDFLRPNAEFEGPLTDAHLPVLNVDWLMMQDPTGSFSPERPPLPGQNHPGLGVGAQVLELLRNVCRRLELAGVIAVPSYFHNALFYRPEFLHFDPQFEGRFRALRRDVLGAVDDSVTAASWALQWGLVHREGEPDAPVEWFQQLMVDPFSQRLEAYFDHRDYRRECSESEDAHRYRVLDTTLDEKLAEYGLRPFDAGRIDRLLEK